MGLATEQGQGAACADGTEITGYVEEHFTHIDIRSRSEQTRFIQAAALLSRSVHRKGDLAGAGQAVHFRSLDHHGMEGRQQTLVQVGAVFATEITLGVEQVDKAAVADFPTVRSAEDDCRIGGHAQSTRQRQRTQNGCELGCIFHYSPPQERY